MHRLFDLHIRGKQPLIIEVASFLPSSDCAVPAQCLPRLGAAVCHSSAPRGTRASRLAVRERPGPPPALCVARLGRGFLRALCLASMSPRWPPALPPPPGKFCTARGSLPLQPQLT